MPYISTVLNSKIKYYHLAFLTNIRIIQPTHRVIIRFIFYSHGQIVVLTHHKIY
ncbi:MAG: hypothetical protein ACJA0T_000385 [Colwellia sp.]|jgi:hypothetical protein